MLTTQAMIKFGPFIFGTLLNKSLHQPQIARIDLLEPLVSVWTLRMKLGPDDKPAYFPDFDGMDRAGVIVETNRLNISAELIDHLVVNAESCYLGAACFGKPAVRP